MKTCKSASDFAKVRESRIRWPICGITGEIVGLSTCWALNHTMKATLIILTMLASVFAASAQQPVTATAEDGRKVLLYPNGQWRLLRGSAAQVDHSVSQEGIQDHIYEFIQDYTLGSGQESIRFRRGERYRGRILMNHHAEVEVNGVSYSVPRGVLSDKHLD